MDNQQPRPSTMNQAYKITNLVNGKVYIGITTQGVVQRWREHICRFNLGERDHKLYKAMRKHGIENFRCETLCCAFSADDLPEIEKELIERFNSFKRGYNSTCGDGLASDETKEKIRQAMLGRKITWMDKIIASRKANPNNRSPREWVKSGSDNVNSKAYIVCYPDGTIGIAESLRGFSRRHNLSHCLLLATLRGDQHHHKGFVLMARFNDYPVMGVHSKPGGNGAHPESHQDEDIV